MAILEQIDLSLSLEKKSYSRRLNRSQKDLLSLQRRARQAGLPVVLVFEGWDAAGKGGVIQRLTETLDPRGFQVIATAAPSAEEKVHHYLWRFWRDLPAHGRMAIFDRSWYGRVMVERVEGFCSVAEWQRAFDEINAFEHLLITDRALILKFFLHISPEEQLRRFEARRDDPLKAWKLTDEDWRNRDKWSQYATAIEDMLARTSTPEAPWHIVAANDKRHARITVIEQVVSSLEAALHPH
jgi:polyphosphate kinase 2